MAAQHVCELVQNDVLRMQARRIGVVENVVGGRHGDPQAAWGPGAEAGHRLEAEWPPSVGGDDRAEGIQVERLWYRNSVKMALAAPA